MRINQRPISLQMSLMVFPARTPDLHLASVLCDMFVTLDRGEYITSPQIVLPLDSVFISLHVTTRRP